MLENRQDRVVFAARCRGGCLLIEGRVKMRGVVAGAVRADAVDTGVLLLRQRGLVGGRAKENRTWEEMGSCAAQAFQD